MRSRVRRPATTLAGLAVAIGLATMPPAAEAVAARAALDSAPAGSAAGPSSAPAPVVARQAVGGADLASPGIVVNYPSTGAVPLPQVPASAYVIADANTGQVLAADDAHGLFPPASTLKVLTAITLIPKLNPSATVVASERAAATEEYDVGLIAGHSYKVSDLFNALLLISANDAAVALTQATGSFAKGMRMINAEAHHLQAYDVVAKQPNGLPADGQVTSAYDQALIARQALSMPAFMKYDSTLKAAFPVTAHDVVPLVNQNTLLTDYPGGVGGKIGWTEAAEATYIGMATRHGVTLIVTVLHCTSLQEITTGEKLLDWGFAMDGKVRPVGHLVPPLPAVTTSQVKRPHPKTRAVAAKHAGKTAGRKAVASPPASGPALPAATLAVGASLAVIAALSAGFLVARRRHAGAPATGPGPGPAGEPPATWHDPPAPR
jgi:D-alanyl-D-alanine carboxypeptidase (penicillin-binding protein 5/6)